MTVQPPAFCCPHCRKALPIPSHCPQHRHALEVPPYCPLCCDCACALACRYCLWPLDDEWDCKRAYLVDFLLWYFDAAMLPFRTADGERQLTGALARFTRASAVRRIAQRGNERERESQWRADDDRERRMAALLDAQAANEAAYRAARAAAVEAERAAGLREIREWEAREQERAAVQRRREAERDAEREARAALRRKAAAKKERERVRQQGCLPCSACGESETGFCDQLKRWLCLDCELELVAGVVPAMERITSTSYNVPPGFALRRKGRRPGTGEGADYFGNHT